MSSTNLAYLRKQLDEDTIRRLLTLVDRLEGDIRRTFLEVIVVIRDSNDLAEIERLLTLGNINAALEVAQQAFARVATTITGGYIGAAESTAVIISDGLETVLTFDLSHPRAVRFITETRLRVIREFSNEQIRAVQDSIIDGIQRGINPRDQARNFRDAIGLTTRQNQAVRNFRRLLEEGSRESLTRQLRDRRFDRTIIGAINRDEPLTEAQIDRMVQRYRERFLRHRSEVIARTEALRAVHEADHEVWQQAVENGLIDPDQIVRTWNTAGDERVRDSHDDMNGQLRGFDEAFESGLGNFLVFPGDPSAPPDDTIQCRCIVTTRIAA